MEFGPRALGGAAFWPIRAIQKCESCVNRLVKKREDFRPFAPAVTCEAAPQYFDIVQGDESLYAHGLKLPNDRPRTSLFDNSQTQQYQTNFL